MFEDEFEEFRARSYSGGFCTRRRRRQHHRSRTSDHLAESPSDAALSDRPSPLGDVPQTAPIHWGWDRHTDAGGLFVQRKCCLNLTPRYRNETTSRLLEVMVVNRRKGDSNESWNGSEMRPRLNSAPQKRLNCHHPRRQPAFAEWSSSEKHISDVTLSYPMRKIRSFMVLGRRCLHGDDDLGVVSPYKDHDKFLDHRFLKSSEDFRIHRLPNYIRIVKEPETPRSHAFRQEVRRTQSPFDSSSEPSPDDECYRVLFSGRRGVGKSTIIKRFLNAEGLNSSKPPRSDGGFSDMTGCCPKQQKGPLMVFDGDESSVILTDLTTNETDDMMLDSDVTAVVIVYSVEDRKSYQLAIDRLYELRHDDVGHQLPVILVANKVDLVRTRVISEQEGKSTAKTYDCKYIEVSAAIDHQINDLLVGIIRQLRHALAKRRPKLQGRAGTPSPTRPSALLRWKPIDRAESFEHRQNSDTSCLLAAREKVLAKLCTGERRASRSCIDLSQL